MRKALLLSVLSGIALLAETVAPASAPASQKKKAVPAAASKTGSSKSAPKSAHKAAPKSAPKAATTTRPGASRTAATHSKRGPVTSTQAKPGQKKTVASAKRGPARQPPVQSWRYTQRMPTPERYKEIQEALATKGYLEPGSHNGVWDTSSVAALKKFQQDQNLEPSGKLDSLSLIALGLGPKHDQSPALAQPQTP